MADPVLKPCPFCGGKMMLREALWPSEGDTDAVIHAESTDCPLRPFDLGVADGCVSVTAAWNRRAAPSETLREALAKHDAFIRELTVDFIGSFDGAELQDMLVRHGLYRIELFDPAIHHDHSGDAEPGDDFYVPTGIARAALGG